ncbi:hypothetical protein [Bacillus cereus]|uniref:Uncharacterized protein n=1 Tax=Bacillus cereus TaxID=1396 RepID=A0A164LML3_BACCE|nr:hypothetical protein [Bacillus cereus]KZD56532.1 hypothetical protein B4088_5082 [Bacillus cereus]
MPAHKSDKPWRQRKIRVSNLEDTLMRLVDSIEDTKSRLVVQKELASLRAKEKVNYESKNRV